MAKKHQLMGSSTWMASWLLPLGSMKMGILAIKVQLRWSQFALFTGKMSIPVHQSSASWGLAWSALCFPTDAVDNLIPLPPAFHEVWHHGLRISSLGSRAKKNKDWQWLSRKEGEGCNWWEDRSARYKATCRAGLSACFQAMFANPSGSVSDVLFANIYVNQFCLLRYFGSGCLLLFIHELWWVCARTRVCVPLQIFAFHYSLFAVHMLLLVICCPLFSFKSSTLCPQELKTILGARCCTLYQASANKGIY